MRFYLQFGYGMMGLCDEFQENWGNITTILSPRDLSPKQLVSFSEKITNKGGKVLVDPQFYLPRSDHQRLISHSYWPSEYETQGFNDHGRVQMIAGLVEYNQNSNANEFIVPGERAQTVDDLWLDSQTQLFHAAREATDKPLIMTICLSAESIRSSEQINSVMEMAERLNPFGYYLVLEHPTNQYIVEDPIWLANSMDLAAGLALMGGKVIVGYSNQQQLIMACTGVAAIASGSWKNVRMFPVEKFQACEDDEEKQRAIWYYCPQALSEFKLPSIEIGMTRFGIDTSLLMPDPLTPFISTLFEAPRPSLSGWKEGLAFRHYLSAMLLQCEAVTCRSYDETIHDYRIMIDRAEEILTIFRNNGLRGGDRNFWRAIENTRTSIDLLESTYGARLRRKWEGLYRE